MASHFEQLNTLIKKGINQWPDTLLLYGSLSACPDKVSRELIDSLISTSYPNLKLPKQENNPDILELNLENTTIKLEHITELQKRLNLGPKQVSHVFVCIHHLDQLNPNAANAFLKTLEEPSCPVIFLFDTCFYSRILPTIKSRCLSFFLKTPIVMEQTDQLLFSEFITQKKSQQLIYLQDCIQTKEDFKTMLVYWSEELKESPHTNKSRMSKLLIEKLEILQYNINLNLQIMSFIESLAQSKGEFQHV